jgi:hypothetical protein
MWSQLVALNTTEVPFDVTNRVSKFFTSWTKYWTLLHQIPNSNSKFVFAFHQLLSDLRACLFTHAPTHHVVLYFFPWSYQRPNNGPIEAPIMSSDKDTEKEK